MRCPEIRAFLHPFLDGELDVEKNVIVLQHLELCGCCRDRFEGEKRLLVRVREGIGERCPDSLRVRIFEACASIPCGTTAAAPGRLSSSPVSLPRWREIVRWPRLMATAAAVTIVFLGLDPLCLFGCPTVRALTREYRAHHDGALLVTGTEDEMSAKLTPAVGFRPEVPHFCSKCFPFSCEGATPVHLGDGGCLVRFRDAQHHLIAFIQARGAHMHPMLRGKDGLYVAQENECSLVGWREDDGEICAFVADQPSLPIEELVALAAATRAEERVAAAPAGK